MPLWITRVRAGSSRLPSSTLRRSDSDTKTTRFRLRSMMRNLAARYDSSGATSVWPWKVQTTGTPLSRPARLPYTLGPSRCAWISSTRCRRTTPSRARR